MSETRQKSGQPDQQIPPAKPARGRPEFRMVGNVLTGPVKPRPAKLVLIDDGDQLRPQQRKERFALNLDRLIGIVGMTRKEAAREIGVPYKLVRRLVSAGVSRTDERNAESLSKIAGYFALPSVVRLWRADLLCWLLSAAEGEAFVAKFRQRLLAERERRMSGARVVSHEELVLLGRTLGVEGSDSPPLTGPYADKVAAILASPKADTFKRVIEDYFALATPAAAGRDDRRGTGRRTSRA